MKKFAAILLLGIFTFNMGGYNLFYQYAYNLSDASLEKALDNNIYDTRNLISIKLATNLPYYNNNETFQRIDGEIEIDGVKYKYVKSRIYNDSLEMLCIPNERKMVIEQSKREFADQVHDFEQTDNQKKSNKSGSIQKNIDEYFEPNQFFIQCNFKLHLNNYVLVNTLAEKTNFLTLVDQPPEKSSFRPLVD